MSSSITFECRRNWVGTYQEAAKCNPPHQHLGKECPICLEKFQAKHKVVVLPCTHGLHQTCFQSWSQQTCPLDRADASEAVKMGFGGRMVTFSPKAYMLGLWLNEKEKQINDYVRKALRGIPEGSQRALIERFGKLIETVLQDTLSFYEGKLFVDTIPEKVQAVEALLPKLSPQDLEEMAQWIDNDLVKLRKKTRSYLHELMDPISALGDYTGLSLDDRGVMCALMYLEKISTKISQHSLFEKLAAEVDRRFFTRHFTAIQASSEEESLAYLTQIDRAALKRLHRLTEGGDPTSQRIHAQTVSLLQRKNGESLLTKLAHLIFGKSNS